MSTSRLIEVGATAVLACCALAVTGLLVKRELMPPPDPNAPRRVEDWSKYTERGQQLGPPEAPVRLLVFSDFECPYCQRFAGQMTALLQRPQRDIRITFRNYPISAIHPHARAAAIGGICADAQGVFLSYHDFMFAHQDSLGNFSIKDVGERIAIPDMQQFQECLTASSTADALRQDSLDASAFGVSGTPTVVLQGWRFSGVPTDSALSALMARDLR